jgi:hypothetical protein
MIGDDNTPDFIPHSGFSSSAPSSVPTGLKHPGNINLTGRPILHNSDGTISSEKSFSIGTDKGETLLPLIVNGKELTQQQAINHYRQTGEHMGIFDTPENADAYATQVHNRNLTSSGAPVYTYQGDAAAPSDFIPYSANSSPNPPVPEDKSGPFMRFIKAAGSRLYAGTLGAGPQQGVPASYGTPEWQQMEANARAGKLPSTMENLRNAVSDSSPGNIDVGETLRSVNPVDVQKFKSGDVSGGIGATMANLLMFRQALKTQGLPNLGDISSPARAAVAQPVPAAPEAAAAIPQGEDFMEYARRGSAGEPPPSTMPQWSRGKPKEMGTAAGPVESEPTPYASPNPPRSSLAKNQAQMAKAQGTASGPVESPAEQGAIAQNSHLNSPTEAQAFLEQASQKLFNKPYAELSVTEKLKTLQEGGKMQQEARSAATPRVPTSEAEMFDLLRQSLIKRGVTPPQ